MGKIDELRAFGADVDEGMARCINNEEFYLKMVRKAAEEPSFADLESAIGQKDYDQAFEIAHALKGALTNLALKPISDPISQIVELLRERKDMDYSEYLEAITAKKEELKNIVL